MEPACSGGQSMTEDRIKKPRLLAFCAAVKWGRNSIWEPGSAESSKDCTDVLTV